MSKVPTETIELGIRELSTYDGWVKDSEENGVTLYTKILFSDRSTPSIKFTGVVDEPLEEVFEVARNINYRIHMNETTVEAKWIEQPQQTQDGKSYDVFYTRLKGPNSLVSHRDLNIARIWWYNEAEKAWWMVMRSVKLDGPQGKEVSGVVRGEFLIQAFKFESVNDGKSTKFTIVAQVEYGGWLPSGVISFFQKKIPMDMKTKLKAGVLALRKDRSKQ
ncbi:hypothetical protein FDP41_010927 [Naegleria fowleri]|uniref:START domain-containing protein n=1 Tax=Naegleria fowleri TaxID=5763 RepID=A0A6A5CBE7_NAEFO|nr:uncharacterized protein FDP41_010927 [Naegleria fowleri]KAF0982948.1 hypothetical protein FDP41_010927 [Naegleria fowleri]